MAIAIASSKDTILLIAHNERARSLQKSFTEAGYEVLTALNDSAALEAAQHMTPSLVVADRQICNFETLRRQKALHAIPIISLAPPDIKCAEEECLDDYTRGADLVLCNQTTKELIAQVRAILRRKAVEHTPAVLRLPSGIHLDLDRHEVRVNGKLVELTPKEFQILRSFLASPGCVFSRQQMLDCVWGKGYVLEEHALDVHVHTLRQKIEQNPENPKFIVTVRGIGYKLRAES